MRRSANVIRPKNAVSLPAKNTQVAAVMGQRSRKYQLPSAAPFESARSNGDYILAVQFNDC